MPELESEGRFVFTGIDADGNQFSPRLDEPKSENEESPFSNLPQKTWQASDAPALIVSSPSTQLTTIVFGNVSGAVLSNNSTVVLTAVSLKDDAEESDVDEDLLRPPASPVGGPIISLPDGPLTAGPSGHIRRRSNDYRQRVIPQRKRSASTTDADFFSPPNLFIDPGLPVLDVAVDWEKVKRNSEVISFDLSPSSGIPSPQSDLFANQLGHRSSRPSPYPSRAHLDVERLSATSLVPSSTSSASSSEVQLKSKVVKELWFTPDVPVPHATPRDRRAEYARQAAILTQSLERARFGNIGGDAFSHINMNGITNSGSGNMYHFHFTVDSNIGLVGAVASLSSVLYWVSFFLFETLYTYTDDFIAQHCGHVQPHNEKKSISGLQVNIEVFQLVTQASLFTLFAFTLLSLFRTNHRP
ncbi:hypothetical protein C8J56DRAFT_480044 [Mycena floridula]|nr:hypothetical protein C8J56DRAFT_480044 [Mycena floridula]